MNKINIATILIILIFALPVASEEIMSLQRLNNPKKELNADEWRQLKKGDVVVREYFFNKSDGQRAFYAKGIGLINASPEKVLQIVSDYEKYNRFLPTVNKTKIIKNNGNGNVFLDYKTKILWVKIDYSNKITVERLPNGTVLSHWQLIKSRPHDIRDTYGFWEIIPYNGKTILTFTAYVDTGRNLPKFVERFLTRNQLPKVINGVRKIAEQK